jgi:hypothetical protein
MSSTRKNIAVVLGALMVLHFTGVPGLAQITGTNCLRFNGTNGYAAVAHDPGFNAMPLTITAWIRTARVAPLYDGIVSKYNPNLPNSGYSLHVYNGYLAGFYFGAAGSVNPTDPGFNGGFVADGKWHHVALVISASTGKFYVDGSNTGTWGWTDFPSSTTTSEPISIGRYGTNSFATNTFTGDIDEVSIWNRELKSGEINYLKHRRLSGNEDGLASLWHLDEASGTTNANATVASRVAILNGAVARTASTAPIALAMVATNCLRFDGSNGSVQVAHNTNLNAYPFTATAWFRTADTVTSLQGIVSKYAFSSYNGWALMVSTGRLHGFYVRTNSSGDIYQVDVVSAASVTDGNWHHAAWVVDASGGTLFLDGSQVGNAAWPFLGAGRTTSTDPVQIGHYANFSDRFHGTLDEITLWNRALSASEIQTNLNLRLATNATGLVAYWRLNEGTNTTTSDATGHGYNGTLITGPQWTGSTAFLGDGSVQFRVATGIPVIQRSFAIKGGPPQNLFGANATASFWRFYDFGSAPTNITLGCKLDTGMRQAPAGPTVAVTPNTYTNTFLCQAYNASGPMSGGHIWLDVPVNFEPTGAQLDSVNLRYQFTGSLQHNINGGAFINDGTEAGIIAQFLHFNGHVFFGDTDTIITNVVNTPTNLAPFAPSYLQSSLRLPATGGHLAKGPGITFGGGAAFNVKLGVNGNATNIDGAFSLTGTNQFFETNHIRFSLPGAVLNASGLLASEFRVWLPTGVGMSPSPELRIMTPFLSRTNLVLGPDLLPASPVTFTAANYITNRLWFSDETKPCWIGADQIDWRIPQGEFYIPAAQQLKFVRQDEDDTLFLQRTNLVDQLAADRISNDGYYRNISAVAGSPVYIRPDTNGAALLSMSAQLAATEYRPHFPYISRTSGGHVPVTGGSITISNDLVVSASSFLSLSNAVPLSYARDCASNSECASIATIGPQVLRFNSQSNQLRFTADGGFMSFGALTAPTNLTWGFAGGTNYAQRTSQVQTGALAIAGTFLRGDQTTLTDEQKPSVLLNSGWGNQTNSTYLERPGTTAYAAGLANYPGLNFRAPATARSYLALKDTGTYPLTARSKYYIRFGGVSGIHEAASFPSSLTLYGYPFTFQTYRLSFLDSGNWESRTDGTIALGGPAGFNVEFERMKLLCGGHLDNAQLPQTIKDKHMVYWNADIRPLSLSFSATADDPCNQATRYLVLGVQTKLPFISEALHASLGFKPNGNLVTKAGVLKNGVTSRFPVPATITMSGPGKTLYTIATGGEGYFNNWETSGHPTNGFYNIPGRLKLPFFRDAKVHIQVTPSGTNTGELNLMGGWPSETGLGSDRGWSVSGTNYFTCTDFDANHDGWPASLAVDQYRNSSDQTYHLRAQQNWIDVALFDYPLKWDPFLHTFSGADAAPVTLPVIDVDSDLKILTPNRLDLDFAQDLNVDLPCIKVLDLADTAVNELNAPLLSVSNALYNVLSNTFNSVGLTAGIQGLQQLTRQNADDLFRPILTTSLYPAITNLYNAYSNALTLGKSNLMYVSTAVITNGNSNLQDAIQNLNGATANADSLFGKINRVLSDVDDSLELFLEMLKKDPSDKKRHVIAAIVKEVAKDQSPRRGFTVDFTDNLIDPLLKDIDPTLAELESQLTYVKEQFDEFSQQFAAGTGDLTAALNEASRDGSAFTNYLNLAAGGISNLLWSAVGPSEDFFSGDPERAKSEIRERLIITFMSSGVAGKYQQTLRQFFTDKDFLINQIMSSLFDQVNRTIREGLKDKIRGARDSVFQKTKGPGAMNTSLLTAKIKGAPIFNEYSLESIHLDTDIKLQLPDEMTFPAYMDIKRLRSETTPIACIPQGEPAAEVTLAAHDVPLDWASADTNSPDMKLSLDARWILQSGHVQGVGGTLRIGGSSSFKGCSMSEITSALAIGGEENYFAGQAKATVSIAGVPVDFRAGIFVGESCSLDALKFIDPEVEKVVANPGAFKGVYLEYGGGFSLSDILLHEHTDFLNVRTDITTALFYEGGRRYGRIGGRQKISADVKLFYVLGGHVDWSAALQVDSGPPEKITIAGEANVCGEVGICPLCAKACRGIRITGDFKPGGVIYKLFH